MGEARWRRFATRDQLAADLADAIAQRLRQAILDKDAAVLAVSGGTTPARFFAELSDKALDWTKVIVTLVDERFVPPTSERSNERLVRENLLKGEARLARFVGLWRDAPTVQDAARRAEAGIALLGSRIDAVVLGMGNDGHTASFFPDAPNLDAITDPSQAQRVMSVHAPSGGEPRLTLTLPPIVDAGTVALHIEGEAKKIVLETALAQETPRLPIAQVFDATTQPIEIYWAP